MQYGILYVRQVHNRVTIANEVLILKTIKSIHFFAIQENSRNPRNRSVTS